ncbi:MAG: hypothetical protein H6716_20485 [Polyangiaceae bacterium]|nr:hypothetical protein [Polyangiaceae bacterium]
MAQNTSSDTQTRVAVVVMRRVNPFVSQALICLEEDGFVPLSVQRDLIAWDNGTLPFQIARVVSSDEAPRCSLPAGERTGAGGQRPT